MLEGSPRAFTNPRLTALRTPGRRCDSCGHTARLKAGASHLPGNPDFQISEPTRARVVTAAPGTGWQQGRQARKVEVAESFIVQVLKSSWWGGRASS